MTPYDHDEAGRLAIRVWRRALGRKLTAIEKEHLRRSTYCLEATSQQFETIRVVSLFNSAFWNAAAGDLRRLVEERPLMTYPGPLIWATMIGIQDEVVGEDVGSMVIKLGERVRVVPEPALKGPPGRTLKWATDFFFSKKTRDRVLSTVIADMEAEYFEALDLGRNAKARWILVRGHLEFVQNILTTAVGKCLKACLGHLLKVD